MSEPPGNLKADPRSLCLAAVLMFLLAGLAFSAGCASEEAAQPAAPALTPLPTPHKTVIPRTMVTTVSPVETPAEPAPVPEETTSQPAADPSPAIVVSGNYHQEYIRLDATSYSLGEVVQFYLVNKGPEIDGCDFAHPPYTVYHLSPTGVRLPVATGDPSRSYMTVMTDPDSATGPFSLNTGKLSAGRYLIRFDCGRNVAREFVIMSRVQVIDTG